MKRIIGSSTGEGQGVAGAVEVYWDAVLDVLRRSCTLDLLKPVNDLPPVNMAARFWGTVAGYGGGSGSLRTLELRRFIEEPIAG